MNVTNMARTLFFIELNLEVYKNKKTRYSRSGF